MFDADQDYAEACNPDKWKILGLPLSDYCEGHKQNLKRISSPFICQGSIDGAALVSALLICSRTWEQGQKLIARKPSFKTRMFVRLVATLESLNPQFIARRSSAFLQYIEEAEKLPKGIFRSQLKPDGKPIEKTHAPLALIYESDLMNHYHCTLSQLMNWPSRKLVFMRYRLLELDKLMRWRPAYYDAPPVKDQEAANG